MIFLVSYPFVSKSLCNLKLTCLLSFPVLTKGLWNIMCLIPLTALNGSHHLLLLFMKLSSQQHSGNTFTRSTAVVQAHCPLPNKGWAKDADLAINIQLPQNEYIKKTTFHNNIIHLTIYAEIQGMTVKKDQNAVIKNENRQCPFPP